MKHSNQYDHYYRWDEITDILQRYEKEYPGYFRLSAIGTTPQGRKIWLGELTDLSYGDFSDKPAFALDGNVHAGEVTGSMVCMYFLDVLLSSRNEEPYRSLLRDYTVYCVPRISPDGSEYYLSTPYSVRSSSRMFPYEEEQNGIQPEDIDGDGVIRRMRIRNQNGMFRISDEDPRLMVKRKPDETEGEFYDVFSEGVLNGNDDEIVPAPERHGEDFNRNFPGWWGLGGRGGAYGLSAPETKAFADFLHDRKNIGICLNFHTSGGMYLYPPAIRPKKDAFREDMKRYQEIGAMCREVTGYPFVNLYDDFLTPAAAPVGGSIDDFCHFVLGIASFTCECWDLAARSGHPPVFPRKMQDDAARAEEEKARLKWIDENNGGEGWSDWHEFDHPQLGKVEIGGIDHKYIVQNPPVRFLEEEAEKHCRFMLRLMKTLPRLEISDLSVRDLGSCAEVKAVITNRGYFPTGITREASSIGLISEIRVSLEGAQAADGSCEITIPQLKGFGTNGTNGRGMGALSSEMQSESHAVRFRVIKETGKEVTVRAVSPRAGKACRSVTMI